MTVPGPRRSGTSAGAPEIVAVRWLTARSVLTGEATGFTPWLAQNLDLLADALGFDELTLVETESDVQGKSLDVLATTTDSVGNEVPVAIENQFGITDHKHLGQLVTYLAQQGRGIGIWVVEDYSAAHVAAIEFLNRTSTTEVGYVLTRVRFTPGPGVVQVHFEIVSRPNEFVRRRQRRLSGTSAQASAVNEDKKSFLASVLEALTPVLAAAGFKHVRMHTRGAYIEMRFPPEMDLDSWGCKLFFRAKRDEIILDLNVPGFDSREENGAAIEALSELFAASFEEVVPTQDSLEWHRTGAYAQSDSVGVVHRGLGYKGGSADEAAQWAGRIAVGWLDALRRDPISDLAALVAEMLVREPAADQGVLED